MHCEIGNSTKSKPKIIYVASFDPWGLSTRQQMFKDSIFIGVPDKNKPLRHAKLATRPQADEFRVGWGWELKSNTNLVSD